MSDLFISYAREDRSQAESLAKVLTRSGWSVWWDRQIPFGKTFAQVIEEQIHAAKCVIVLWSKAAVKSGWVQNEAAEGQQRGILAPVFIDDVPIPFEFRRIQAARLVDWHGEPDSIEFRALREAIERITGRRPPLGEEPPRTGERTSQTEVGLPGGENHEQTEELRPEQNSSQIVHPLLTLAGDDLSQKFASSAREGGEGKSTHPISKEREYTQAFFTLLASTLVILAGSVILFAVVPTFIGQHRGADWRDFLPWIPGMGVAMIAGTLGAFTGGLLQIWLQVTGVKNSDDAGGQVNELYCPRGGIAVLETGRLSSDKG